MQDRSVCVRTTASEHGGDASPRGPSSPDPRVHTCTAAHALVPRSSKQRLNPVVGRTRRKQQTGSWSRPSWGSESVARQGSSSYMLPQYTPRPRPRPTYPHPHCHNTVHSCTTLVPKARIWINAWTLWSHSALASHARGTPSPAAFVSPRSF